MVKVVVEGDSIKKGEEPKRSVVMKQVSPIAEIARVTSRAVFVIVTQSPSRVLN
jgi:hypothetical protein